MKNLKLKTFRLQKSTFDKSFKLLNVPNTITIKDDSPSGPLVTIEDIKLYETSRTKDVAMFDIGATIEGDMTIDTINIESSTL